MTLSRTLEALGALVCAAGITVPARSGVVVEYRTAVMKSLGGHMKALTLITTGGAGYPEQASLHASSIDDIARILPSLFPPGTGPEAVKTEALAAVWKDAAGFKAAGERLQVESSGLVRAAKGRDAVALRAQTEAVAKTCSACHDAYRVSR